MFVNFIINLAMPGDLRMDQKEAGKIEKYKMLKDEIARM